MNKIILSSDVISQVEGNVVSDMEGDKVMLSIENGKYYNLGDIGGEIWELIQEPIPFSNLISSLIEQYEVNQDECEKGVQFFLNQLLHDKLIQVNVYKDN